MDKRDQRIDLKGAYEKVLEGIATIRATHPDSKGYIWRTKRDERVRELHEMLEGQYCEWDDPPVIAIATGGGSIHGHPGMAWNCRCWAQPIEKEVKAANTQLEQVTQKPITKEKQYKEQIDKYARKLAKMLNAKNQLKPSKTEKIKGGFLHPHISRIKK